MGSASVRTSRLCTLSTSAHLHPTPAYAEPAPPDCTWWVPARAPPASHAHARSQQLQHKTLAATSDLLLENIQMKHLQHTYKTTETLKTCIWNTCKKTPENTWKLFANIRNIQIKNICNIYVKTCNIQMKHLQTYVWKTRWTIWNIH
jgi:hypothetical protein